MRNRTKKRINWVLFFASAYILFFALTTMAASAAVEAVTELTPFQTVLLSFAEKYPIVGFVLTALAVLVVLFSVIVAAFPRVDKNGRWAKVVKFFDFLSVFYPKWKTPQATEEKSPANGA